MPYIVFLFLFSISLYAQNSFVKVQNTKLDELEIKQLLDRCSGGDAEGCFELGFFSSTLDKKDDRLDMVHFYEKACLYENALACYLLASSYRRGSDDVKLSFSKAMYYYRKACTLNDEDACVEYNDLSEGLAK